MYAKVAVVLMACVVGYLAQEEDLRFRFADEAETYLYQPLSLDFSCEGREYGYYADVANACQVFHICWPAEDEFGSVVQTFQWSFICGNQTVFDQSILGCQHVDAAIPCDQSEQFFNSVPFGAVDEPAFREA